MNFRDLINSMNDEVNMNESVDDPIDAIDNAEFVSDDDDEMDDLENLTDEELDQLADDLSNGIDDEELDAIDDMDDEVESLTPAQDAEADAMMNVAATSQLIQNEMDDDDRHSLVESVATAQVLVDEGFMLESDMYAMLLGNDDEITTEKSWYANRQRIELGKEARLKQLFSVAVSAEARAHNDPDYRKLQKVYKMRNILRARLEKKYSNPAKKRVRDYVARLKQSKNGILRKMGERFAK